MTIETEYIAKHPTSAKLYQRGLKVMPSGMGTDARRTVPFPIYVNRAQGSKKWDVDGNEYLDLWSGHGGLLLGHNHPAVVAAVQEQLPKGFHYSACNELELEMAELVCKLVPCADKVRWATSGTEANMLAIRIARGYTGKKKVIKFRGHFHGYWNEGVLGVRPPFNSPMSIGVPEENLSNILLADHNSSEDVRRLIEENDDVACVIMDPICHAFIMPNRPGFLEEVRQITREKGVVLIWDEVVAGFRLAPGGAQEVFGVTPDLVAFSKTVGCGLPYGAVAGRAEVMAVMEYTGDAEHDRFHRVMSQGTHGGNAVVSACGLASLKILATGEPQARMNRIGAMLRDAMNQVSQKEGVPACVYGDYSIGRVVVGMASPEGARFDMTNSLFRDHEKIDAGTSAKVRGKLYLAMLNNGVDYLPAGTYWLNAAVSEKDVDRIAVGYGRSLASLKKDGMI
ncbi:MAG: aminotransferase class III-fold pyridoxal phosphate-dependent enzyme [Chloroflexota bacterium]